MKDFFLSILIALAAFLAVGVVTTAVLSLMGRGLHRRPVKQFFSMLGTLAVAGVVCVVLSTVLWLVFSFFYHRLEIFGVALYTFGGAAWTFMVLHIQEHFFLPDDLTSKQLHRLDAAKWWLTLIGAMGGLIVGLSELTK